MHKFLKTMKIKRLCPNAILPRYMSKGASGLDLHAAIHEEKVLVFGERCLIPTGLCIQLPPGCEGQIRPRSGLAHNFGVTVLNSPGTIDMDYRGEIGVVLVNLGRNIATIAPGDRIAQLVVVPVEQVTITEVHDLNRTSRGDGGLGSTGL